MTNESFWDVETSQNYALCNEFMTFSYSAKVRKSMPKWFPKPCKNQPKSIPRAPGVDLFIDFIDFGPCRKIVVFPMAFLAVQKSKKSSLGAPGWFRPANSLLGRGAGEGKGGVLITCFTRNKGIKDLHALTPEGSADFLECEIMISWDCVIRRL